MNGSSVGLDPGERILRCSSAWMIGNRLIIELSTPQIRGGWVPEAPCRAHEMKKLIFGNFFGGGG